MNDISDGAITELNTNLENILGTGLISFFINEHSMVLHKKRNTDKKR